MKKSDLENWSDGDFVHKENMFGKEGGFWEDSMKLLSAETCCAQSSRLQVPHRALWVGRLPLPSTQDPAIGTSTARAGLFIYSPFKVKF